MQMRLRPRSNSLIDKEQRPNLPAVGFGSVPYYDDSLENSVASLVQERRDSRWPIFTHFSVYRRVWEYLILFVSLSCIFEVSFISIFVPHITLGQYAPFLLLDLLYILDLYVVTHTSYLFHGVTVVSVRRIKKRYGKFATICHIIGAIPLSWIACLFGTWWVHLLLSLNRLFRLRRAVEAADTIIRSLIYSSWFARLFPLFILLLLAIHFFASIFYLAGYFERNQASWIYALHWDRLNPPQQYVVSVYFVMTTILTIGFGDLTPQTSAERIVVIFIQLMGVLIHAYLVGTMVSLLIDPIGRAFTSDFLGMWSYLKWHGVPDPLRSEILHNFQEKFRRFKGTDEARSLFRYIPETVQNHLKLDIVRKCLNTISLMNLATERLLLGFANVMKPVSYSPGEVIIRQDEIVPILFMFNSGIVDVYMNDSLFAENCCDDGVGFGELELFVDQKRSATVVARTNVDGWTINRRDLIMSMSHQLDVRDELLRDCKMVFPSYYKQIRRLFFQVKPRTPIEGPEPEVSSIPVPSMSAAEPSELDGNGDCL